ncbi:MAG TPA: DNA polymerase III subunit gamma/tau [Bacteroidota bacterium]|nr:DNA polymerase III subunit gamma/tau [Bacteroidota bacterium]
MSDYIVTARKWRPTRFEDVIGQEHVTSTLRNALATHRLAHAYLFSGPRGVGKTTTARLLAKVVNCKNPTNGNPDNTCENCVEVNEGRSFDVLEIDGASNRGVEEIRNLREAVKYAPAKAARKVYIIDEVHMLTKEAFNALLKTLEEPPAHILFIFATTELQKLPATILSRCQRFEFRRIPVDRIKQNLASIAKAENITLDDEALQLIARKGDGSLRDAQSTFDMVISLCGTTVTAPQIVQALNVVDQELYFRVTDLIKEKNTAGALALVEDVVGRGYDLKEFAEGLVEHMRNLLIARATGSTALIEASDVYRKRYAEEGAKFSPTDLMRFQRLLAGTASSFRWVAQPRFKLEADLVQLMQMPGAQDVGEVLRDLDALKKKLFEAPLTTAPAVVQRIPPIASAQPSSRVRPGLTPLRPVGTNNTASHQTTVSAPSSTPRISEGEVMSRWKEFVDLVARKKISLGAAIEAAVPAGVVGAVIRVRCGDPFHADQITRNREALSDLLEEAFHVRARLEPIVEKADSSPESRETSADEDHPMLKVIKKELGARPVE